ncbi:MAG TPA: glycosyltransferase [Microlunatus sp.]|nr:glycosyltransferase [Microlunatus sp.]
MRILFVCAAGLGHVHPLIPLARAAVAAGDEVLFATAAEGTAAIERLGFPAVAVPAGDPGEVAAAWARLPDRDVNTYVVADIFVRIQGRAALPAQRALIESFGADLVVSAELGALVAAQASGTPSAYVGITALDLDDLDLDRVVAAIDDLRAVAGLPRSGRLPFPDEAAYLSPVPPTLWADPAHVPAGGLWYRHEDAEGPVSSVVPDRGDQRPRIYATLGSVAGGNQIGRLVVEPLLEALGRLDADVTFTVGALDVSQIPDLPVNVTLAEYIPQAEAMTCDLAVVHGGSGTTVAALARGLPMVAVPMFADQMHNADRLVEAHIGRRVDPDRIREQLTQAIEEVLTDPSYRANAQRVAESIAARPTPADAWNLLRRQTRPTGATGRPR